MSKKWIITIVVVAVAVILAVVLSMTLSNHRPTIDSLEADPENVLPLESSQITCTAADADNDELSYNWSASGGEISGLGAVVTWTAPGLEDSYNVTVMVTDGQSDVVTDYVTITVKDNKPPVITSLVADAEWTLPSESIQLTCAATDPDGDVLGYEWTTDGGAISGTGDVVNWIAPEETGLYNITVVVTDGYGMSDTQTVSVHSALEQPTIIENLEVTADHCYLKEYSWGYKVGREKAYHIECVLSDTDIEASYEWSCEIGTISGEGSIITWTAPDEYVEETTVTVMVPGIGSKGVALNVVSCSPCTFGC